MGIAWKCRDENRFYPYFFLATHPIRQGFKTGIYFQSFLDLFTDFFLCLIHRTIDKIQMWQKLTVLVTYKLVYNSMYMHGYN